jgi:hypothetical protein
MLLVVLASQCLGALHECPVLTAEDGAQRGPQAVCAPKARLDLIEVNSAGTQARICKQEVMGSPRLSPRQPRLGVLSCDLDRCLE